MTRKEAKSCIGTIELLQRLAYNIHGVMDVIDAGNCKKIIEALKKEPIKGHWISTAEDLPNIDEDVLVTDIHGNITVYTLKDDWEAVPLYWEDDAGYYVDFSDVVAWMPLPQPYVEADKGD